MKINSSQYNDTAEANKNDKSDWRADKRRRQIWGEKTETAIKYRTIENPVKEETKFAEILESAKPQKLKQAKEDSSQERRDDDKKDKKNDVREGDSTDSLANGDRIERHHSSGGGQFGSSGGFGEGNINQTLSLSENFAARSILHIADLERMISAIRAQTNFGGKREIQLELKRSVLKGLKVKITTDSAAQVQIEFLAANEKVRSQIENHSEELANILRGRGINLNSLRTTLDFADQADEFSPNNSAEIFNLKERENLGGNTFEIEPENKSIIVYK